MQSVLLFFNILEHKFDISDLPHLRVESLDAMRAITLEKSREVTNIALILTRKDIMGLAQESGIPGLQIFHEGDFRSMQIVIEIPERIETDKDAITAYLLKTVSQWIHHVMV